MFVNVTLVVLDTQNCVLYNFIPVKVELAAPAKTWNLLPEDSPNNEPACVFNDMLASLVDVSTFTVLLKVNVPLI
jgi:hypothetical protein